MDIGYFGLGIGALTTSEWVRAVAATAEQLGFASIWAPEHVILL
ncbi:MAG: LLM class F420-dependent oxidoreductase, partial [Deltaproteobacteria bacterium]|nr:LLM class F420-dependent oxidoreductase [Deltaproteobacteria bacterium]